MCDSTTTPCVLFQDLLNRPMTVTFDVPNASFDGAAVLLKAAAHVLLQELRLAARGTARVRAQVGTLRLELLKIGAVRG
jgi:hypothetical protein